MNKRIVFAFLTIAAVVLGSVLSLTGQPVAAQDHSPGFSVFIEDNHVKGWDWPLGVEITLEIDNPATPKDPDYIETQYAHEVPGSFNEVHFGPDEAFAMGPGQSVTLSGGDYTKETIITYLAFDGVDMPNDILWGNTDPGAVVTVKNFHQRDIVRWETADSSGYWEADFSVIGDQPGEEHLHDFSLGTRFMIFREDGDGDKTQLRDWTMPFPTMEVRLTQNLLEAQDWPLGYPVDITIDDPATGPGADYTNTVSPEMCWFDADQGCFWLPLGEDFRAYPGHMVTLSNDFLTKTHTISALQVNSFDYDADLVCGIAEPDFEVETRFQYDSLFFQRYETAAADGTWCADFSVSGDEDREQYTYDLLPFTEGTAHLRDEDGDTTQLTFPYNLVVWFDGDNIDGSNWLADVPVTLEIKDPLTPLQPDYKDSATPVVGPWFLTNVKFDLYGLFDLQPGHIVRFTQGDWLKELVVSSELAITEINYLTDTVSGTAAPGAHVMNNAGYSKADRVTVADSDGNWSVDYSITGDHIIEGEIIDLLPGDNIMAAESDQDADSTNVSRRIDYPWIDAGKTYDDVVAIGYARAGIVTLTVDDPTTAESPDYTTTQVIGDGTAPWNDQISYQPIVIPDWLDLQTGMVLNIFDDEVTKQVVLSDHEITNVNLEADTVSGVTAPGTELRILLFNEGIVVARRAAVAQSDGTWSADFSVPGSLDWEQDVADIHTGSSISASYFDEDGDRTRVDWTFNQPPAIISIQASADPVPVNTSVDVSATFNDPDPGDAHTAVWDWGDGTISDGLVDEVSSTVSGSHAYLQAGVYTLSLTLCDAAGQCDTADYQYIVVYDSAGGFVTGGGWIDSPVNENYAYMQVGGKATFGFVSRYKKGADVPEGYTEFQFNAGDLNFHSNHYKWMVVTGSNYAKFMGKGTINGEGINADLYRFQIWAGDNTPDTFRIKIWWEDTEGEHVVYDNGMDQAIGGGSIVIHTQ